MILEIVNYINICEQHLGFDFQYPWTEKTWLVMLMNIQKQGVVFCWKFRCKGEASSYKVWTGLLITNYICICPGVF